MIGGGVDVVTTRIIGYNAYKLFMKGEIPTKEEIEKELATEAEVVDVEGKDVKDIDTESLENAIKNNVTVEDVEGEEVTKGWVEILKERNFWVGARIKMDGNVFFS